MRTLGFTTQLTHYQTLSNGVRLSFIKPAKVHKNARKASVSVTLDYGHFHATNFPEGFAHLYEHLLFNASGKYKNTDALDKHLFNYHGQVNGWTQDFSTNFQLNCDQEGFLAACEILVDRLSSPLFLLSDIEKEIATIDAEFKSKKRDPVRQLLSVQKATCNPAHPFSMFSTGNRRTLGVKSTEETQSLLCQYHKLAMQGQHLCICIGLPRHENAENIRTSLQSLICTAFSKNPASKQVLKKREEFPPVYIDSQLNCLINVRQNDNRHQLIISYILPRSQCVKFNEHRNSLYVMICHLLESKHRQGLFCTLKTHSFANDIHSYFKAIDLHTDELVVSIQLSNEGAEKSAETYAFIQCFIDFLSKQGIEAWRFREKSSQYATSLHMDKGSSLLEDCIEVSQGMLNKGALLSADEEASFEYFTENHINDSQSWSYLPGILAKLTSKNTRVYFISENADVQRKSKHFETPYSINDLSACSPTLSIDVPSFVKPRQNPYMSCEHPLITTQIPATQLVHLHSPQINFKFYQDLRFNLPNGECYISITEPSMHESVHQTAAKRVWLSCLNEFLSTEFFDVELASIHFRVYAHHHGICIHTGGLSERQLLLCIELINAVRTYSATIKDIERHIDKTITLMQSRPKQRPINQLFTQLNEYYLDNSKKQSAILESLLLINAQQIHSLQKQYFQHNYVESLLVGNWQLTSAKRFYKQLNDRFESAQTVIKPNLDIPKIKPGQHIHWQLENSKENHFVWHFIPLISTQEKMTAKQNPQLKQTLAARSLVLEKLLSHTMFEELRQQQKMGYELGVGYKPISNYPGIAMYVVSSTHGINDIYSAMLQVIKNTQDMLTDENVSLQKIVSELIKQVSPRDTDISQTASRTWLHFEDVNPILGFEELIVALKSLELTEIMTALDKLYSSTLGQVLLSSSSGKALQFEKFKSSENLVI